MVFRRTTCVGTKKAYGKKAKKQDAEASLGGDVTIKQAPGNPFSRCQLLV